MNRPLHCLAAVGLLAGCHAREADDARAVVKIEPSPAKSAAPDDDPPPPIHLAPVERHKDCCKGRNDCKGMGNCKTDRNDCKGKNDCKGLGGCKPFDC